MRKDLCAAAWGGERRSRPLVIHDALRAPMPGRHLVAFGTAPTNSALEASTPGVGMRRGRTNAASADSFAIAAGVEKILPVTFVAVDGNTSCNPRPVSRPCLIYS